MYSSVITGSIYGITPYLILAETDVSKGLPGFEIVGCPNGGIREARERIRVALKNTGIKLPALKITVNLSPADVKKEGTSFDLPIAAGILIAIGSIQASTLENQMVLGELGLDGEIRAVKGILPIVLKAKEQGIKTCFLPVENVEEGEMVEGVRIVGVKNLRDFIEYLKVPTYKQTINMKKENGATESTAFFDLDFSDICGQKIVKRAAEISAAGFHHLLIIGPPGVGKTMIAQRMPTILPPLTKEESLEVSKIYSVSGLLKENHGLIKKRPFLNPHHTVSLQALTGGGKIPKPGILSLAHKGVLFLDEFPEFPRNIVEILRQPLEEKEIRISRAHGTFTYPADCIFIAAMNPCPCGYYPDSNRCHCTDSQIRRYIGHISGPILDRIDLCVEALPIHITDSLREKRETSEEIRFRVLKARKMQQRRFKKMGYEFNAQIPPNEVEKFCFLEKEAQDYMNQVYDSMKLSLRGYHRVLRVARTIADLEESDRVSISHLSEAMCFRMTENRFRG